MANLAFLAIAVGIFAIGSLIVWLRSREKITFDSSIDEFQSQLGALAPDEAEDARSDDVGGSD